MAKNDKRIHQELPEHFEDPFISVLHRAIRLAVRLLAALMVVVILWGVADVVYLIYQKALEPPLFLATVSDVFQLFGAFMVVLIAIEIFINIRLYLGTDVLPVKLVVATALMAIARKLIVFDYENADADYLLALAAVVAALGLTYWFLEKDSSGDFTSSEPVIPEPAPDKPAPPAG
ncbi:MAG: phosphate-starvation-inducible PsiE family protein [Halieaceae bacterium]